MRTPTATTPGSAAQRHDVHVLGHPQGPVLLLLHGFGTDQSSWNRVLPALTLHHRVVLLDQAGAGGFDATAYDRTRYSTLDGYAADLVEVCEELDLHDVTLVGHSVSAMIAARVALAAPDRIRQVVMLVPSARYTDDPTSDPALVETLGTVSGAWQPILLRAGTCTGVLGIVWRHRREDLDATLAWALHTLAREAAHTLERADLLAQLTEASQLDPLTGVGNRRHWDEVAAREVGRAERSGDPLTFALIDLDHFKAYNDAYGHLIGDDLLREFAAAASAQLRPGDTIARWGGEEFALALPGYDLEQARDVADRIRAVVPHAQTATAGLAQWTPGASAATVLARADAALYRGKEAGRDTTATA